MPTRETQIHRLDRIEEKIDKLSEAMISLARAEEKLINFEKQSQEQATKSAELEHRLDKLERCAIEQQQTISNFTKLFWIVIVAVIGTLVSTLTALPNV
jgi:hypothetical protein